MQLQDRPVRTIPRDLSTVLLRREDEAHLRRDHDVALATLIGKKINDLGYPQTRGLGVSVEAGHVSLTGRLNRYYVLQLVQSALLQTPGVHGLTSFVRIIPAVAESMAD